MNDDERRDRRARSPMLGVAGTLILARPKARAALELDDTGDQRMLALDDPRWRQLDHRGWHGGSRYHLDPDAPFVPEELSKLLEAPWEMGRFRSLWPYLCSEGTTWAAAYAAVPYVVEVAAKLPPERRSEHLAFLGVVVIDSCPEQGESFETKPYLMDAYHEALTRALPLLAETLVSPHDATETCSLLAAAAALKGHPKLGALLDNLDCVLTCPRCGTEVVVLE